MSRSNDKGNRGKGELWSRRAAEAKVQGTYNARWVKKVTTHKERRKIHVALTRIVRGAAEEP